VIADVLRAAVLGIVQGLTEFLPVSSTGHLILTEKVLRVDQDRYGLSFDAAIHLGTLLALLWYFRALWLRFARGALHTLQARSLADDDGRLAWLILLGTIPAAIIGLLLESWVESTFRSPVLVGSMLIAFSAVFIAAEALGRQTRVSRDLTWRDSLFVGFAQAMALVPGVSRSGATICAGLFRDIERHEAASFAFLLSAPIIAGAGGSQMLRVLREFYDGKLGGDDAAFFATGFVMAALVGYVTIAVLLQYLRTNSLRSFVYYRVALGIVVLAVVAVQALA
jgi:undecaprenyl-diphosphatase